MIYIVNDVHHQAKVFENEAIEKLPTARKQKAIRYRDRIDGLNCAVAYLLVKYALKKEYGLVISSDFINESSLSKPRLAETSEIEFSISHCKHAVACIISESEVGIDVEGCSELKTIEPRLILSADENQMYRQVENKLQFLIKTWTIKEAIAKCQGTGLSDELLTETIFRNESVDRFQCRYGEIYTRSNDKVCLSCCSRKGGEDFSIACVSTIDLLW